MKESINGVAAQIVRGATTTNTALDGLNEGRQSSELNNKMGSLSCAYSSVGELKTRMHDSSNMVRAEPGNSRT